jgi:hypothetical protein
MTASFAGPSFQGLLLRSWRDGPGQEWRGSHPKKARVSRFRPYWRFRLKRGYHAGLVISRYRKTPQDRVEKPMMFYRSG